eukprot:6071324-Alexandrium_andersonii.AAC.1
MSGSHSGPDSALPVAGVDFLAPCDQFAKGGDAGTGSSAGWAYEANLAFAMQSTAYKRARGGEDLGPQV